MGKTGTGKESEEERGKDCKTPLLPGLKKAAFLALYCKPTSVGAMIAGFEIRFEMYGLFAFI